MSSFLPAFFLAICTFAAGPLRAAPPDLPADFGRDEIRAMTHLIARIDSASADTFSTLENADRAAFLSRFWDRHCPAFAERYVDFLFGDRRPNVSTHFYNDAEFLPSEYWVHTTAPDTEDLERAVDLLGTLVASNGRDGVARIGLAYCLLELSRLEAAEGMFREARRTDRSEAAVYNGLGLSFVKRRNAQSIARDFFREALALDRGYRAASYNLAMSQLATRAKDVPFHIRKVTRAFPDHPDIYYKLGVWHEIRSRFDGEFLTDAMEAYEAQTDVNPGHHAAWANLARVKMRLGRHREAARICTRILEEAPAYRIRVLPVLMEAYQAMGRIAGADSAASRYVAMLDPEQRAPFQDISFIASREEKRVLDTLSGDSLDAFVHDFWLRHDPTPGTPENEKRVEHVRRVGNAMVLYSEAVKPWDTRGDVYVRYGEPRHKSRSDNMRFETDPEVVRVRERLLGALADEERNEIRKFHRRIRTSTRDVERAPVPGGTARTIVSDFESAEFGFDPQVGDSRFGRPDPNEGAYQRGLIESINDRLPPVDIRGVPLFPVEGNRPWEYWVYTDVGPGIEVVFSAFSPLGGYGFAQPPQTGRKLSRFNELTFSMYRPENVMARAITRQPSLLRMRVRPMAFAYDYADFRGDDGRTRLEVYVGRRGSHDTTTTEAAMIVYDKGWRSVVESSRRFTHAAGAEPDTLAASTLIGAIPPGQYILAMQLDDPQTGEMGAERLGIEVEPYPDSTLALSDVAFASRVVPDSTEERREFRVTPNPWRRYGAKDPVVVFYEIYGLREDAFGRTRYRTDYRIEPADGGTIVADALRGLGRKLGIDGRESLTISYEQTGEDPEEFGFVEIDVSGSSPGAYAVTVTVTDRVTGAAVEKSQTFRIDEPRRPGDGSRAYRDSTGTPGSRSGN